MRNISRRDRLPPAPGLADAKPGRRRPGIMLRRSTMGAGRVSRCLCRDGGVVQHAAFILAVRSVVDGDGRRDRRFSRAHGLWVA
jgi:hypothetical protein